METDSSLVWADSRVELHSISGICLNLAIVIHPSNLECKDTLWFYDSLDNLCIVEFRMLVVNFLKSLQYFMYRQEIFLLIRILGLEFGHQIISLHVICLYGYYFTSHVEPLRSRSSTHWILDFAFTSAT